MPVFSESSEVKLASCDVRLQSVVRKAIEITDFAVSVGHRSVADQDLACETGHSQKCGNDGLHTRVPSPAVDLFPVPYNWADRDAFVYLAGIMHACAAELGVKIRWGGNWPNDGVIRNQGFQDLGHFELVDS